MLFWLGYYVSRFRFSLVLVPAIQLSHSLFKSSHVLQVLTFAGTYMQMYEKMGELFQPKIIKMTSLKIF